jgi:type IV pilus assembly protein PilF
MKNHMKNKVKTFILSLSLCGFIAGCSSTNPNNSASADNAIDPNKKQIAADANIQLGMAYLEQGDVVTAKQKLLAALNLTPKYPPVWYTMGYFLEATGETQKANEYYLKAIDLAPHNGDALNNYGTFLCHTGKTKESIHYFIEATQDPNYLENAAAYENAGLCALKIPNLVEAKQYFSKALTQDPKRVRSLIELATVSYKEGDYVAAKNNLQQALTLTKPTASTLLLAAQITKKLDGRKAASVYIKQLQTEFPQSKEAKQAANF